MMNRLVALILLLSTGTAFAAVEPGENLLINGTFETEQLDFPMFWQKGGEHTSYDATGGPDGAGAVVFSNPEGLEGVRATCRQHDLLVREGETYKMSAWVKTEDFSSGHCGVIVHNSGWHEEAGIRSLPENTDGWEHLEETFEMPESEGGAGYGVAIFAINYVGEVQFANVTLEAVSEGALEGSAVSSVLLEQQRPRLVAWEPLLNKISLDDPELTFHYFGVAEQPHAEYDCVYTIDGETTRTSPLTPELNSVDLSGIAAGDHTLEVALVERDGGEKVFDDSYTITLVETPEVDTSAHRRLNNLVVEVLAQPLQATAEEQAFEFSTTRDGWVFIKVETEQEEPEL
ncbi:MAG: carbohydrate binding domain-containing protein, partial [Armatimonadota bacterium]